MTTVAHIRNCLSNWGTDPGYLFIGRPGKWGNPFSVREHGREKCIELYREWIIQQEELMAGIIAGELKDKTLVCYCKPQACHGDVLIELTDQLAG